MSIELSGAGETLAAIVVSNEVGNQTGGNIGDQSDANARKNCANCGAQLTGAYCHACGQSSHIHRSLLHMVEEVLHGIFHFDTKAWRTLPALVFKPGHLTKQYIEGKRTSFVSPLALFLFLIFLMFFVFSYTMDGPSNDMLNIPGSREEVMQELTKAQTELAQELAAQAKQDPHSSEAFELRDDIYESQFGIRKLQDALNQMDGKERDVPALTLQLATAEKHLNSLRDTELAQKLAEKTPANAEADAGSKSSLETNSEAQAEAKTTSETSSTAPISVEKIKPFELAQSIRFAEREVKYLKKQLAADHKEKEKAALKQNIKAQLKTGNSTEIAASAPSGTKAKTPDVDENNTNADSNGAPVNLKGAVNFKDASYFPYVGEAIEHATKNPELTLYKMKKNASALAFLLMPIALPFLWLLFAFKRKYVMFDHAVFSLYSLSFMCILLTLVAILAKFDFKGTATFLFILAPPLHMYAQLKHAYSLSRLETLWRTFALLFIALISLTVYASLVTLLSA